MKALYVDRQTWQHRLPPRLKLIVLVTVSVAVFLLDRPLPLAIAALAGAACYFSAGMGLREALRRLIPALVTIVAVALFTLLFQSAAEAVTALLRLTALMLFAGAVTATVSITQFMDEITLAATPLEKAGLARAADIGLASALVVRFVPEILGRYEAILQAQAARGVRPRALATLMPLIILTLRDADSIAAAIDARGFRQP